MANTPLCIIAGRGGSKRLPNKNLLPINGKSMTAITAEQAVNAGIFEIAISSDSPEILNEAKNAGANIIINRPAHLATDEATSFDVIKHAILEAEKQGKVFDYIVFLQITSPLRLASDIQEATKLFLDSNADSVISVCEQKNLIKPDSNNLIKDTYFQINGAIYIWKKSSFLNNPQLIYPNTKYYVMPTTRSIDIDTEHDYRLANAVYSAYEN